jgi:hypothetical protein
MGLGLFGGVFSPNGLSVGSGKWEHNTLLYVVCCMLSVFRPDPPPPPPLLLVLFPGKLELQRRWACRAPARSSLLDVPPGASPAPPAAAPPIQFELRAASAMMTRTSGISPLT